MERERHAQAAVGASARGVAAGAGALVGGARRAGVGQELKQHTKALFGKKTGKYRQCIYQMMGCNVLLLGDSSAGMLMIISDFCIFPFHIF